MGLEEGYFKYPFIEFVRGTWVPLLPSIAHHFFLVSIQNNGFYCDISYMYIVMLSSYSFLPLKEHIVFGISV